MKREKQKQRKSSSNDIAPNLYICRCMFMLMCVTFIAAVPCRDGFFCFRVPNVASLCVTPVLCHHSPPLAALSSHRWLLKHLYYVYKKKKKFTLSGSLSLSLWLRLSVKKKKSPCLDSLLLLSFFVCLSPFAQLSPPLSVSLCLSLSLSLSLCVSALGPCFD